MFRRFNPAGLAAAGGGVLIFLLLALIGAGVIPSPIPGVGAPPAQATTQQAPCTDEVHVHFYDSGKQHEGDFGKPVTETEIVAVTNIEHDARCVNPYLTATHVAEKGWITNTDEAIQAEAERYKVDRAAWKQAIDRLDRWEAGATVSIRPAPVSYWTYMMRPGPDNTSVSVHQTHVEHGSGRALVYERDGLTVMHRLDCLFQPVSVDKLPEQVPPVKEDQPQGEGGGEVQTSTPNTPTTTPQPPGKGNCKPSCPTTTTPPPSGCTPGTCGQNDGKSSNPDDYVSEGPDREIDGPATQPDQVDTSRNEPAPAPVITPGEDTDDTPVDTGGDTNHGTVPEQPAPGQCNPDFQQC